MKKNIILSLITVLSLSFLFSLWYILYYNNKENNIEGYKYPETDLGIFLNIQHAMNISDFETASILSKKDIKNFNLDNINVLSSFMNGELVPIKNKKVEINNITIEFIKDAEFIKNNNWQSVYKRHSKDNIILMAPFKIWSSVAVGKYDEAIKFVLKLKTSSSLKNFLLGQIYVEKKDIKKAAYHFANVETSFMNLNDYLYVSSFYKKYKFQNLLKDLKNKFSEAPISSFVIKKENYPDWINFSGPANQLAFSIIQNLSHTGLLRYSNLSLIMLRFAEIIQTEQKDKDSIYFYLGQHSFNNNGEFGSFFDKIDNDSYFKPFAEIIKIEKTKNLKELNKIIKENPLFLPGIYKLASNYIQNGEEKEFIKLINKSLKDKDLQDNGRIFLLKLLLKNYLIFDDLIKAQETLEKISNLTKKKDTDYILLQSLIWIKNKQQIEDAYKNAIKIIKNNSSNIDAWIVLGYAIKEKEDADSAIEVVSRVAKISTTNSHLFELLGDLYKETNKEEEAKKAYLKAKELSSDGNTSIIKLDKKLDKLKIQ